MNLDEKIRANGCLHSYVNDWRGRTINTVAYLDYRLGLILLQYFRLTEEQVFAMRLTEKIKKLEEILKDEAYSVLTEENNWIEEFKEIARYRNIFAHAFIDYSGDVLEREPSTGVSFIHFRSGKKQLSNFTINELNDWNGRLGSLGGFLSDLERLINWTGPKPILA